MKSRLLKSLHRKFIKGFTLMIIPRSSYKKVISWRIPLPLAIIILCVVTFNVYIFIRYTTQIWQINRFHQDIARQNVMISKLRAERPLVQPVLEKDRRLESELTALKQINLELSNTLKRVQKKGRIKITVASRGGLNNSRGQIPSYVLAPLPNSKETTTALAQLDHNLDQLEEIIKKETADHSGLLRELQAYERQLDHTPSIWPVYTRIVGSFGQRFHPVLRKSRMHEGVDLRAPMGTRVRAAADGIVSFAGWNEGYGYLVKIRHDYGYETRYAHNSRLLVRAGQSVKKGQNISLSGNTGVSTGPHLHYEVLVNGKQVNPVSYLNN